MRRIKEREMSAFLSQKGIRSAADSHRKKPAGPERATKYRNPCPLGGQDLVSSEDR